MKILIIFNSVAFQSFMDIIQESDKILQNNLGLS